MSGGLQASWAQVRRRVGPAAAADSLDPVLVAEVRAALSAGASPSAALLAAADRARAGGGDTPPAGFGDGRPAGFEGGRPSGREDGRVGLQRLANAVRAGRPLAEAAATVDTGDPAADLLVRALGVAERTGAGSALAVDQALAAARDEAATARLLRARTAQARGTAVILTLLPLVTWLLLVGLDRGTLAFYATPAGVLTGSAALTLAVAGQWWARRLIRAAGRAAAAADPLAPAKSRPALGRAAVLGAVTLAVVGVGLGPAPGFLAASGVAVLAGRRRSAGGPPGANRAAGEACSAGTAGAKGEADGTGAGGQAGATGPDGQAGGAAEAVELVAVALAAGLSPYGAVAVAGRLAPCKARPVLVAGARRMRTGWGAGDAFAGTGLAALGSALAVSARWGAPAEDALRGLATDLRAQRRAAVEEAAERTQLSLVFPTTLLTLPAFVLGVVPPLLWTAFAA